MDTLQPSTCYHIYNHANGNDNLLRDLGQAVAYIHLNPVKHGFVTDAQDWEWTSFQLYLHQQPTFINRQPVLEWFEGMKALSAFISFIDKSLYSAVLP